MEIIHPSDVIRNGKEVKVKNIFEKRIYLLIYCT